jgi:hypothetical protein
MAIAWLLNSSPSLWAPIRPIRPPIRGLPVIDKHYLTTSSAAEAMRINEAKLLLILRIGHDTSMRGEGLSLRDALARSQYSGLRAQFGPSEFVPLLRANPDLITQWLMYCEDKRTRGGFWVDKTTFDVGSLESPESTVRFGSLVEAVAEFVVRELDCWSEVGERRTGRRT